MPRAIWSGTISFGLVSVPVRMFSAIGENDLRFHLVHEPDGGRIGYQKTCKADGKPVPDDEIVKAFELEKARPRGRSRRLRRPSSTWPQH